MQQQPVERFDPTSGRVTAVLVLSSALGLLRDLVLAALFGASDDADAFFVAWTVPETVAPLVTESGLGLVLVPLFARTWTTDGSLTSAIRAVGGFRFAHQGGQA